MAAAWEWVFVAAVAGGWAEGAAEGGGDGGRWFRHLRTERVQSQWRGASECT